MFRPNFNIFFKKGGGGGGGGGGSLSDPGLRGKYSKSRYTRCILLNIFVQDCSCATRKAIRRGFETVS